MRHKIKLRKQLQDRLYTKYKAGKGTAKIGKVHNGTENIHSHNTYHTYKACVNKFADYCKANGIKTLSEARASVPDYITSRQVQGKSAFTLAKDLSALAKAFDCRTTDFSVNLPSRHREDIRNNRGVAARSATFQESQYKDLVDFVRACGCRRAELERLTGDKIKFENGKAYIVVDKGTKGGRPRVTEITGENKEKCISMMRAAGTGKVFPEGVPARVNTHHYRAEYARTLYREHARDVSTLAQSELYICRGSMVGMRFDRDALKIVSQNLGHNREDVVVNHYFY